MSELTANDATPWFRIGWVWAVIAIPFSAVAFGVVMIVSANYQPDDLVVDDYYKAGMGINREIAFDKRAASLAVSATLQGITSEGAIFHVTGASDALTLNLFHVTDSERDLNATLVRQTQGIYTVHSPGLVESLREPGVWYLELRDEALGWRLRSRVITPTDALTLESAERR